MSLPSRAARLAPVVDMAEEAERKAAQRVGQFQQQLAQAQAKLAAYARVEGLRKLVQRYLDEARRAEDKREQRLLDELSQRLPRQGQAQS